MLDFYTRNRDYVLTRFYPIDTSSGVIEDKLVFTSIEQVPDEIYGKYVHMYGGYSPVWMYVTLAKKALVIKHC